jgi:hypothetical protein
MQAHLRRFNAASIVTIGLTLGGLISCSKQPTAPQLPLTGYVSGTITRPQGGHALTTVRVVAVRASCQTDTAAVSTLVGTLADSLGHYLQPVLADPAVSEACLRVIAADYLVPDDSVASAVVRLPMRIRPDTIRVDLTLP